MEGVEGRVGNTIVDVDGRGGGESRKHHSGCGWKGWRGE